MNFDDLLLDAGDDSLDVLREPRIVLLLASPRSAETVKLAALIHEGNVVQEAQLRPLSSF